MLAGGSQRIAATMLQMASAYPRVQTRPLDQPHLHSATPTSAQDDVGLTTADAAIAAAQALQRRRPFHRRPVETSRRAACEGD
jgi:hypothetical protein